MENSEMLKRKNQRKIVLILNYGRRLKLLSCGMAGVLVFGLLPESVHKKPCAMYANLLMPVLFFVP